MAIVVSLKEVVGELESQNDINSSYLDKDTGKFYLIQEEERGIPDGEVELDLESAPDWQKKYWKELIEVFDNHEMVPLPSSFDIHEYKMMEDFCYSVQDDRTSNELLYQIHGSGAFRRFKDAVHRLKIADDWYAFRDKAYEDIAIEWLEENGIAYTRE